MLIGLRDLLLVGAIAIDEEGVRVDIEETRDEHGHDRHNDNGPMVPVLLVGECGQAHVDEDEGLAAEGHSLEEAPGEILGFFRQVVRRVVGHDYSAEEDRDDAGGLGNLCDQVARVGEQEEEMIDFLLS